MPDQIELRALRVTGICGALPEEQQRAQPLEVDLEITADLAAAGASDSLSDTVDYGEVCRLVDEVISGGRFQLLEALATRLAEVVLDHDRRIESVTVAVRKLRPPVPQHLATSGVRIGRSRAR